MTLLRRAVALAWAAGPSILLRRIALAVLAGLTPLGVALLTRDVLDGLSRPDVMVLALALALAGVVSAVLPRLAQYADAELGRAVSVHAREELFSALARQEGLARLEHPRFHDRLQLAADAGPNGPSQVVAGTLTIVEGLVVTAGFVVTLALLGPWALVLVALAALPTLMAELKLSRSRASTMMEVVPATRREIFYASLLTSLSAAQEVRLLGLSGLFRRRMVTELKAANASNRRLDRRELRGYTLIALLGAVVAGVGVVWAISAVRAGHLTVGDFVLFMAALVGVQSGLNSTIGGLAATHGALLLFGHYQAVIDTPPDLAVPGKPRPLAPLTGGIELRDVWFRYADDQPWVLRGINLTFEAGRSTAVVGLNGAGKSTLVKLLCRFYDPDRGSIRWDGVDLREVAPADLRSRMAAVFQDFMSYEMTAAENIAVGSLEAWTDRGRVERAAVVSGIHPVLAALPAGYDTMLTRVFASQSDRDDPNTGVVLSGGQWQRVAMARALIRGDRDLMILDEPSSGLDAEAEDAIHRRLADLRAGRTSVLITHRLNAVRDADVIVVLSAGAISETGSHDELIALDGTYSRLFGLQARGYAEAS